MRAASQIVSYATASVDSSSGEYSLLRVRIDPQTGEVLEQIEMPTGVAISGLESNGRDIFFCGGANSGKLRAVRNPTRSSAVKS
jgi:hypothetical protein